MSSSWNAYIKTVLDDFSKKKGWYIMVSSIVTKVSNFLLIMFAVRTIPKEVFGQFSYAQSVMAFLIPMAGAGLNHALVRFGPLEKSLLAKKQLYQKNVKLGLFISTGLLLITLLFINTIVANVPAAKLILLLLSTQLFSVYFLEIVKSALRVFNRNKSYAVVEMQFALLLLLFGVIGVWQFGILGLCVSYTMAGLVLFLWWRNKIPSVNGDTRLEKSLPKGYVKYGVYAALGGVASALMYQVDILTIGNLIPSQADLAVYRVATHLPYSLIFLSLAFVHAHYVSLAKNYKSKSALIHFLKQYYLIFIPVGLVIYGAVYVTAPWLISAVYGNIYTEAVAPLRVLFLGLLAIFWLRVPFGNLLGAVGKSSWNAAIAAAMIIANVLLNIYLVSKYGIIGAAWATTLLLTLSGSVSLAAFFIYLKKN